MKAKFADFVSNLNMCHGSIHPPDRCDINMLIQQCDITVKWTFNSQQQLWWTFLQSAHWLHTCRHRPGRTCSPIMLLHQHRVTPHLSGGRIILTKCSLINFCSKCERNFNFVCMKTALNVSLRRVNDQSENYNCFGYFSFRVCCLLFGSAGSEAQSLDNFWTFTSSSGWTLTFHLLHHRITTALFYDHISAELMTYPSASQLHVVFLAN